MGYRDVFVHVGDNVRIRVPQGYAHAGAMVAPLVTGRQALVHVSFAKLNLFSPKGTFGGSDFIHSLIGGKCINRVEPLVLTVFS
jgi:hypothetical protein